MASRRFPMPSLQLTRKRKKETAMVGLEIEAGSIGAAEVRVNGEARVTGAATAPLPPEAFRDGEVTDPDSVTEALRALFDEHKLSKRVRLGIANQRVVVRTLRLPAIEDPKELDAAVRFAAQEQIAMPLEQAVIDHRVVGGVANVAAAAEGEAPAPSVTLFCGVGDVTNLAVAKGSSCLFTRVSPVGLEDVAGSLASTTGLTPEHARMWLDHVGLARPLEQIEGDPETISRARAALEQGASSLLDELRLSLDFYGAQEAAAPVERVVLCGPGSAIPGLAEQMQPVLGVPIEAGRPEALAGLDPGSAARLTLPYGLALDR
jgi:type IV pilus assembly protein PilM